MEWLGFAAAVNSSRLPMSSQLSSSWAVALAVVLAALLLQMSILFDEDEFINYTYLQN